MYRVHIDDRLYTFLSSKEPAGICEPLFPLAGDESRKELTKLLQSIEENPPGNSLFLTTNDLENSWKTFCSIYDVMEAAGGIVMNNENKLLMIFRNGRWDLPKGKIEEGEERRQAAIREVTEETGIGNLSIVHECNNTFHIYPYKNKKILKCTYWFRMQSSDESIPMPQQEEGITAVEWMTLESVKSKIKLSYSSIVMLLQDESLII